MIKKKKKNYQEKVSPTPPVFHFSSTPFQSPLPLDLYTHHHSFGIIYQPFITYLLKHSSIRVQEIKKCLIIISTPILAPLHSTPLYFTPLHCISHHTHTHTPHHLDFLFSFFFTIFFYFRFFVFCDKLFALIA